ncbi:hypothetical protein [Vibrio sp. STUT-A11]|uniref:hypothetical protein n=1 Tax=Vibrio sp. STUT-A11 TaxID=2976236 RepID=UPI002230C233|nr:hypothetical protein [Vibrio sp. STUT-A11]BDR13969.1 hypothetical protein VspSTUT11_19450 [Vibrio sp. STUT-A11]
MALSLMIYHSNHCCNWHSHCELLASQAEVLYAEMQKVSISRPECIYVSANRARVLHDAESIRRDLAFNMCQTVRQLITLDKKKPEHQRSG